MPGDIRSSGCGSTGDGRRARQVTLQFTSGRYRRKKGALQFSNAPLGKGSVSLPSIANCLAGSSFRFFFFKKFKTIADERPDRNHHGSGEPDEEQCFQKQYKNVQHDLGTTYFPNYAAKPL